MDTEDNVHLYQQLEKVKSELQKAENVIAAQNKEIDTLFNQVEYLTNGLLGEREQRNLQEKKLKDLEDALNNAAKAKNEQDILLKKTMKQLEEERAQRILLSNEKSLVHRLQNSQVSLEGLMTNWEQAYNDLLRQKCEAELPAEEQLKATHELQNRLFNDTNQKMADQMRMDGEQKESSLNINMEKQPNSRKRGMANWRNLIRIKKLRRHLKRRQGLQRTSSP